MYAVHMEHMERPELGLLADRTQWSAIPPEDLFRLLKLAESQDGLDVSDQDIVEGHHRTEPWERLLSAAYALGCADTDQHHGMPDYDAQQDRALAWSHAEGDC